MNLREELGNFPTRDQLKRKYGGGITYAIDKQYGGLKKLACKLNIDLSREKGRKYKQEPRYYNNIENVKKDILSLCVEYERFPTQREIGKKSVPLDKAIQAFPGGRVELAREIGYPIDSDDFGRNPGYWNNLDNLNNHIKICVHDLGRFPTYDELSQRWGGICQAIYKHYGSLSNCATKLGYSAVHKPKGYFQNIKNIIRDLLPLCEKFNRFPSSAEIIKNLGGTYSQAIKKLGGRVYFANI